jgi:predicted PurR-regulated permease PerM
MDAATITRPMAAKDSTVAAAPPADLFNGEPPPAERIAKAAAKAPPVQIVLIALGTIAFLYFARPVVLPVFLACVAGMTLKPLIRWLTCCHIPPALSAAFVLCFLVGAIGVGFFQLGRPALTWMNEAPQHMTDLRQRVQNMFPRIARFSQAAAAVNNLGATEQEKKEQQEKAPTVEVKDSRGTSSILGWTGTLLVGLGETLVLVYLLLASGDLFLQKLVRVMPTLSDKKRAVEVSHEIQQNISNYLFSVSLINLGLGMLVSAGLYCMGVHPSPAGGCHCHGTVQPYFRAQANGLSSF